MKIQNPEPIPFRIHVSTIYVPNESRPEEGIYFFAYKIRIENKGHAPAQLISRHWIISDLRGHSEEVRGPGVVGVQPRITPGNSFEYESACPLNSNCGSMRGFYDMKTDDGEVFQVEIPEFFLVAPCAVH